MHRLLFNVLLILSLSVEAEPCARIYRAAGESLTITPHSSIGILQTMTSFLGCQLTIVDYQTNHSRRIRLLENGQTDVMPEASWRIEREAFAWYSEPYRDEVVILVALKTVTHQDIQHINDVAKLSKRILTLEGGWLGPDVERERSHWHSNKLIVDYKDPTVALRDLRLRRADVMLTTDLVYHQVLQTPSDLVVLPFEVHREAVYLIFSKRTVSEAEVANFNRAIQHWRQLNPQPITLPRRQ